MVSRLIVLIDYKTMFPGKKIRVVFLFYKDVQQNSEKSHTYLTKIKIKNK